VSETVLGGRRRRRGRSKHLSIRHGRDLPWQRLDVVPVHGIGIRTVAVPVHECRWWGGGGQRQCAGGARRFEDRVVLLACVGTEHAALMRHGMGGGGSFLAIWAGTLGALHHHAS
jgi:hypothetical protein